MGKKANPFTDNPFGNEDEDPFRDNTVPQADSSAWGAGKASAWSGGGQPATIPLDNGFSNTNGGQVELEYMRRKDRLDLREKELNAKEAELKKQEAELLASGALRPKKNWPRFYPITRHDIDGDVPEGNRRMVRYCYWAYLGFIAAVTWNLFGALMALCVLTGGGDNGVSSGKRVAGFLIASLYWVAGIPGAWILWYMRIYNCSRNDRALTYAWFFLAFAIHIAFCIWAAVSPPLPLTSDWSHTGFVTCIKAFDKNTFVGAVYVIGGAFWSLEALWSLWAMKTVYSHFRGSSGTTRLKSEAAGALASRAVEGKSKPNFGAGDV